MYFILTALAAIVTTILWYRISEDKYQLSTLCFIYWGATLMWLVDHVIAFLDEGGAFFEMTLDATLLGIIVVLCGFFVWGMITFVKVTKGTLKN
ncbi:MAG: hypothetical protein EOM28_03810 [Clostridia bacterium]|nr:hypothetical protein [Clostridia bacterium]